MVGAVFEEADLDDVACAHDRRRSVLADVVEFGDGDHGRGIVGSGSLSLWDHCKASEEGQSEQQFPGFHGRLQNVQARLPASHGANYDATDAVFLHRISILVAGALLSALILVVGCSDPTPPAAAVGPRVALARVTAGTGSPADDAVARIRSVVEEEEGRLVAFFGGRPAVPYVVFVHATREQMPEALVANLHPDCPGFVPLGTHTVHLVWGEMRRTGASLRGVVIHELVHELLDQFVAPHGRLLPRWFHEGLAQFVAGDTYLGAREDELVWRASIDRLLPFDGLRSAFPSREEDLRIAYAQSYSYVAWLVREYGMESMLVAASAADDLTSFEGALVGRTRRSTLELQTAWKDHLVHGSGAPWRVLFDNCFTFLLVAALPVLALALTRRLAVDRRAAQRLDAAEAQPAQPDVAPELPTEDRPEDLPR